LPRHLHRPDSPPLSESGKTGIEEGTREFVVPGLPYIVAYRVIGP